MDNIPYKRKRWNTIGFIAFIVYLFIVLGLMIIGRQYPNIQDVIQMVFAGVSIVLVVAAIINCLRINRKKSKKSTTE